MKLRVKSGKFEDLSKETVVVFCTTKAKGSQKLAQATGVSKEISELLIELAEEKSFVGKKSETIFFRRFDKGPKNLLLVGIGESKDFKHDAARRLAAVVLKGLRGHKIDSSYFWMDSLGLSAKELESFGKAFAEGIVLTSYKYDDLKTKSAETDKKAAEPEVVFCFKNAGSSKGFEKGMLIGEVVATATNLTRRLGDTPANIMTPTKLADEAKEAAKGTKLKVTIWNKERIQKEKMGMFLNVAKGSSEPPTFIVMEYKGGAAKDKPIALVGKGLTFDSGGISIKPSPQMDEMKYDMCGGAAVIGAMRAIALLKLKVNVVAFVPASENMPGNNANKPGDVSHARNGKTVEVLNTDAEGRLILGDALVYACEQKPAVIFDVATLTGAIKTALGETHTGFFCRDDKLVKKIEAAAEASGEWIWQLPLVDEHVADMKGNYADLANISTGSPNAGASKGAAFLSEFVDKDIPWAHFDIAATAWNVAGRLPYCTGKGASGVMVRTFVEFARIWKAK